ncbi:MAG TPA: hypothetical protein VG652_05605 [Gaiellaceae bacterium]|nr:hypothetical protein [Gaiellaceae bacterium]
MSSRSSQRGGSGRRWWALLTVAVAGAIFVTGVGLGEALHDNSTPTGEQTIVRTLNPLPLLPAPATTVTVTTSKP